MYCRNEHYLAEFKAICEKQDLDKNLGSDVVRQIEKAIFYQRPLKSQKGQVGKCVFEKNKTRCPSSHPMSSIGRVILSSLSFQEITIWQFLSERQTGVEKNNVCLIISF
jgi:hypothetical protein